MALPGSGAISLNAVNVEIGNSGTATISMNDADVRTLFDDASGTISLSMGCLLYTSPSPLDGLRSRMPS